MTSQKGLRYFKIRRNSRRGPGIALCELDGDICRRIVENYGAGVYSGNGERSVDWTSLGPAVAVARSQHREVEMDAPEFEAAWEQGNPLPSHSSRKAIPTPL